MASKTRSRSRRGRVRSGHRLHGVSRFGRARVIQSRSPLVLDDEHGGSAFGPAAAGWHRTRRPAPAPPVIRGSTAKKTLPRPGSLRTPTWPPCASTMRLVSARPRPVPGCLLAAPASSCWNSDEQLAAGPRPDADRRCPRPRAGSRRALRLDPHRHPALLGRELDRVGEVVVEHLLELAGSVTTPPRSGSTSTSMRDPLLARPGSAGCPAPPPTTCARSTGSGLELHLARLDLRQVEHVVDQLEQVTRAREDVAQELLLLGRHRAHLAVVHQLAEADDGVQGRAQLVGHVGQELALQAVGLLNLAILLLQNLVGGRELPIGRLQVLRALKDLGGHLLLTGAQVGMAG